MKPFTLVFMAVAILLLASALSGCTPDTSEKQLYKMVDGEEEVLEEQPEADTIQEEAVGNTGPSLCYPCVGPHLKMDGTIGFGPSLSPGISLY